MAQLVARLNGIQEATSSNLVSSTSRNLKRTPFCFRFFTIKIRGEIFKMDIGSIIKSVGIDYIKSHNQTAGKVVELFNHIDETVKCAQNLPAPVQAELQQMFVAALAANGISININR